MLPTTVFRGAFEALSDLVSATSKGRVVGDDNSPVAEPRLSHEVMTVAHHCATSYADPYRTCHLALSPLPSHPTSLLGSIFISKPTPEVTEILSVYVLLYDIVIELSTIFITTN